MEPRTLELCETDDPLEAELCETDPPELWLLAELPEELDPPDELL